MADNSSSNTEASGLPAHWEVRQSKSRGMPYYFNTTTGQSQWERPTEEQLKAEEAASSNFSIQDQVRASHILVKHKDSRRPSSWKQAKITRSVDEAMELIKLFREQIESHQIGFAELATKESDCSSAKNGGDLGYFGRGQMQKPFEDVAFALEIGAVSEPVVTESGVHIIMRTA